jgi:carbonic anhydrase
MAYIEWGACDDKASPTSVQAATYEGDRSATNYAFVNAVSRKNVELTIANIRQHSPVLAELETGGTIKVVGAMYNLGTGAVEFFD